MISVDYKGMSPKKVILVCEDVFTTVLVNA